MFGTAVSGTRDLWASVNFPYGATAPDPVDWRERPLWVGSGRCLRNYEMAPVTHSSHCMTPARGFAGSFGGIFGKRSLQRHCAYFSTSDQTPFHPAHGATTRN